MEWVASTLHTTSKHGLSSITTADAHTSAASSRLNWRPCHWNGLARFAERRNLDSARVPSYFRRSPQQTPAMVGWKTWSYPLLYENEIATSSSGCRLQSSVLAVGQPRTHVSLDVIITFFSMAWKCHLRGLLIFGSTNIQATKYKLIVSCKFQHLKFKSIRSFFIYYLPILYRKFSTEQDVLPVKSKTSLAHVPILNS